MTKINLTGTIVPNEDKWIYDEFGIAATSPQDISEALDNAEDDVTVLINSGGGDLFAGNEIYYLLHESEKNITADITAFAASAATVAACGASHVRANPGAQYMIHCVSTWGAEGNHADFEKMAEILQEADRAVADVYELKTGLDRKELLSLMESEKWMDAKEALSYGFIDEIIGAEESIPSGARFFNSISPVLSTETIARFKDRLLNPYAGKDHNTDFLTRQRHINLLQLKGGQK